MKRLRRTFAIRGRWGTLAIFALAIAWATVVQSLGWSQTSNYALVRALSHGTPRIDRYHWETGDESYYKGHYYSVKAPGMSIVTLPLHKALAVTGADDLVRRRVESARRGGAFESCRGAVECGQAGEFGAGQYGGNVERARLIRAEIQNYTPLVWMLGLLGAVIPAMLMLFLVRTFVERIEPGTGTAAAIVLGTGTLVMPFATMFFSHVLSAMLAFACFFVLWRERERPARLTLVAGAGALGGFAVTSEYPLAIASVICGLYAISRGDVLRRGLAYAGGAIAGVTPLLLYNLWAFGSVTHFSYADAVTERGASGHDVLGLNSGGLFGVGLPSLHTTFDLLFSSKGLFVLSPVLIMSLVGTVLMYRRGWRAEALVVGAIFASVVTYNSGYWLPFGGGSPGPRFLIPALPFLAVGLGPAWRRFPATTLALAVPSALTMIAATVTFPMIGDGDTGLWAHLIGTGNFEHTLASAFGAKNGWLSQAPLLLALLATTVLAALATPRLGYSRDVTLAACSVVTWGVVAALVPNVPPIGAGQSHDFLPLIVAAGAAAIIAVMLAVLAERRPWSERTELQPGESR
jgi:hypothetical protein